MKAPESPGPAQDRTGTPETPGPASLETAGPAPPVPALPVGRCLWRPVVVMLAVGSVAGCAATTSERSVSIKRTTHGVAHIEAPDYEALAYGVAYAHAEDNVCQTANQLVTVRGERSRWFGAETPALLGLRMLPNEQIDIFIRSHMDDAALVTEQESASPEALALATGYVAGYNRFLSDHENALPTGCDGEPWVRPMTDTDYWRLQELTMVQIGIALMADALVAAAPPSGESPAAESPDAEAAAAALEPWRLNDPLLGSNGWAFGSDVTSNGRGLLLGNPHFPWVGPNRFWQMHLSIPGRLDVMGASIGHSAVVQIGFNRDVAWTHTVSTGKRFTLHELELVPGEPTQYRLNGETVPMTPETVSYEVLDEQGDVGTREHTVWNTHFGPVVVIPRAGLGWTAERAYALQDANASNLRAMEIWVGLNRDKSVGDMRDTLAELGVPWVNTIAADRHGSAMYADVSVVPDVDAEHLARCTPSDTAAQLFTAAGLVVLDGSTTDCDWNHDPASPVPGLLPIERMPVAVRRDWVQNSNDSYWLTNPDIEWPEFSPLVGPVGVPQSLRTRSGLSVIRDRLSGTDGIASHRQVGLREVQTMLFENRNHAASLVLDDLLAICAEARSEVAREACTVLADWDRRNNLESRGAHLFREWWRLARETDAVWRIPFDPDDPVRTPARLNTGDLTVRLQLLDFLNIALDSVRAAGFEPGAPLGDVQVLTTGNRTIGLHGGMELEGVLNKLETRGRSALEAGGYQVNFGSSYIQAVTFDDRGPVAEGMLTYGQSSQPDSPLAFDQLPLYASKKWPSLPFHPADIARQRVGEVLRLTVE